MSCNSTNTPARRVVRWLLFAVLLLLAALVAAGLRRGQPGPLAERAEFPWGPGARVHPGARVQYAIGGAAPEAVPLSPEDFREIVSAALVVPDRPSNAMPPAYFYLYTWDENGGFADCGVGPAGEIILGAGGEHHYWREPEPAAYATLYELAFGGA